MPHAFTTRFEEIVGVLQNNVHISQAFHPEKDTHCEFNQFIAIWDTGATQSVITQNVVDKCDLKPVGMQKVYTASGQELVEVYRVNFGLPNKVLIVDVPVTKMKISGEANILIGMDIIHQGDFVITNYNNKTMFSFRIPSMGAIDFVKQAEENNPISTKHVGRNAPCPCGSGKKYKNCCGKI